MQSFSISLTPITPNIATVFTILVHLAFGNELTATKAFTLVATLNTLRAVMGATPWSIRAIAESQVALRRLKSILVMEDMSPLDKLPDNDRFAVLIKGGTFAWDKLEKENDQDVVDERDQVKLRDMNSDKKKVIVSSSQQLWSASTTKKSTIPSIRHQQEKTHTTKSLLLPSSLVST
ncbi:putative multidrug resistance-associated protein 5 [Apostichopus japonicus]|uniref:Putative multidrug resistance-associated protein 5 n=1 Tax=Stichopus japonicus TaxID=307972 RepID=A0A2G8JM29_STIJA|nr:putative multidrug resistance-associated protein 5 [Apostichopus japonicus]